MQGNRELNKAKRWLERHFAHSPQREAEQYFRQYPAGQALEDFQRVTGNTLWHLTKGRTVWGALALLSGLAFGMAASNGDVDTEVLTVPPLVAFGALAVRDQRRRMFWNWVHEGTATHGLEHGQQCLRAAQRGEYDRRPRL